MIRNKPRIYQVKKGILPKKLRNQIQTQLDGVSLKEPLLKPFVNSGLDIRTTIIFDNMARFIDVLYNSKVPWRIVLFDQYPKACRVKIKDRYLEGEGLRKRLYETYRLRIKTPDFMVFDTKRRSLDDDKLDYWRFVHEFFHSYQDRLKQSQKDEIFDAIPDSIDELANIRDVFGFHKLYEEDLDDPRKLVYHELIPHFFLPEVHIDPKVREYLRNHPRLTRALEDAGYKLDAFSKEDLTTPPFITFK